MKNIIVFLLFVSCFNLFSQSISDINFIVKNSNLNGLKDISKIISQNDSLKNVRISNFLISNPNFDKSFKSDIFLYEIEDIVDGKPVYISNQNSLAAAATKTNRLHPGGSLGLNLEGQGLRIGVWDGGRVLSDHQEFLNADNTTRALTPDYVFNQPTPDSHATHVSGTIGAKGINILAKGMAPKSTIATYNWTNDENEVIGEISNNGLLLSNHSYGIPVFTDTGALNLPIWRMGCYDSDSFTWDQILYNAPFYLMVTSAGNNGGANYNGGIKEGFDKLTGEKNAKNNLVVANANPFVSQGSGQLITCPINSSSSQGPSDDGRIKPDIAGDGTNLLSTWSTGTTNYSTISGTSMASPNVAGSLLLLQEYYKTLNPLSFMKASSLKALVCHTAIDFGEVGPDPVFGWGLLNSESAATLIKKSFDPVKTSFILESTLIPNQVFSFTVILSSIQDLSATLCWTDPAGQSQQFQLNSNTPALVNDLDLRIIKTSTTFLPWKLQLADISLAAITGDNIVDNLEKVDVINGNGSYLIQVSHKGILTNGNQNFSLIVSGFNNSSLTTNNYDANSDFFVYPNPTNSILNYTNPQNIVFDTITITDIVGKSIKVNSNNNQIDVSNLQSGVYFVKFFNSGLETIKKFIKY